jgi:glycosyltransferase involved in cell wall biosynthesis
VKVLLSAFQCSPGRGSEPGAGWHWATALADYGHEVTVLTSSDYREPIVRHDNDHGIEFRFVDERVSPLHRLSNSMGLYDTYLRWQSEAYRQVPPEKFDVVHHVTWGSLRLGSKMWQLPIPLVYGPIGGGQLSPARYRGYFGRDRPIESFRAASAGPLMALNRQGQQTLRHAAVTLACNSDTANAARRAGGRDVRLMMADALPDDWVIEARDKPAGTPVVLWVGRMLRRKAPTLAVEAFAELRRHMPARMIMAGGEGPMTPEVRAAVERLGLTGDVELLGQVHWDRVRELYASASVFLFTSLRESFGGQFLEALGKGLPAVALDLHGISDAEVGDAAIKVPLPDQPAELPSRLGAALQTVLTDGEWEHRSTAAVKWASEQVWPARAAAVTEIYRDITGTRR